MSDFIKKTPEFPKIPYEKIEQYGDLLESPDDFRPQVHGTILRVGVHELTQDIRHDVSIATGEHPITVSLLDPTHHAALYAISASLAEHLNLATTESSDGNPNSYWEGVEIPLEEFNRRHPDQKQEPYVDGNTHHIFTVTLYRNNGVEDTSDLKCFFRTEYRVENRREYEQPTDRKFFKDLYNELTFQFPDKDTQIAQLVAKYALAGFPWPNRSM